MRERLRDLAAGVVCVGFPANELSQAVAALEAFPLAGFVLFSRNADSIAGARAVTDALREPYAGLPPVIAMDEEGGAVARLQRENVAMPSAMAMCATGDPQLAWRAGAQTGHDLRRAGINLDFAPVLDLALRSENTVIGTRAFAEDPNEVARFGGAFADGLIAAGIVPTYKHFPGHGSTPVDSHTALPVVEEDQATLRERDLRPFRVLLPRAPAAMSSHIIFRAFDAQLPGTLSPSVLSVLLRDELQFQGVCFTDCMQMDAISQTVGTEVGSVRALAAGADCVLVSNGLDVGRRIVLAIEDAVAQGSLPMARLRQAHTRVAQLRRSLAQPLPIGSVPPDTQIGEEIGRRAIRWVRGQRRFVPARTQAISFGASLRAFVPELDEQRFDSEPVPELIARAIEACAFSDRSVVVLTNRAHLHAAQRDAVQRIIESGADACVVSTREPFDLACFPAARSAVATYGDNEPSMRGLGSVLFAEPAAVA